MKKIFGLALIGCLGLSLTGCKGDLSDFDKQMDKMEEVVKDGEIFKEDWKVVYEIADGDEKQIVTYKKDGKNFYGVAQMIDGNEEEVSRIWFIKESDGYTRYEYETKKYSHVSDEEFEGYDVDVLDMVYESTMDAIEDSVKVCELEGYTCSVEKKLLGKVILTIEFSDTVDKVQDGGLTEESPLAGATMTIVVKKGKLLEFSVEYEEGQTVSITFDYSNQEIDVPNKDDYRETVKN